MNFEKILEEPESSTYSHLRRDYEIMENSENTSVFAQQLQKGK